MLILVIVQSYKFNSKSG